jgi:chromosome segregation ATPase
VEAANLELEVKNLRTEHLEQQLREFEAARDRLRLLQADLSDAIGLRRAAESRLEAATNDFERRSTGLLARIQSLEHAANEWDRTRSEFERAAIAKDKELSAVKGQLRDLQNSQRPETAEPLVPRPSPEALELGELRERHQALLKERDAIASELELRKQDDRARADNTAELAQRVAELEEALRNKDAGIKEQVTRTESLLWRVAELEPFAAAAARMEENLRRQEAEITAQMAMHAEGVEKLRSLERLTADHASQSAGLKELLARKDGVIAERSATVSALEKSLAGQTSEIRSLSSAQGAMRREVETWKDRARQWEQLASKLPELENVLRERDAQIVRLKDARDDKDKQLTLLEERLTALSERMADYQQRLVELEPLAAQTSALEEKLAQREAELTRLKVSSAQRIRRIRQSITNFKP